MGGFNECMYVGYMVFYLFPFVRAYYYFGLLGLRGWGLLLFALLILVRVSYRVGLHGFDGVVGLLTVSLGWVAVVLGCYFLFSWFHVCCFGFDST